MSLIRPLSSVEHAFTLSNETFPLCVVIALHLSHSPSEWDIRTALKNLQERYLLLRAGIVREKGKFHFREKAGENLVPFDIFHHNWQTRAEELLNTYFDPTGPLMKCFLNPGDADDQNATVLLVFHHSIIDGTSARTLLHEFLTLISQGNLPPITTQIPDNGVVAFPPAFRGGKLFRRMIGLMTRQLQEEAAFLGKGIIIRPAPDSANKILSVSFPDSVSRTIIARLARENLSLNSAIQAAMLLAIRRHMYSGIKKPLMRTLYFADIRPQLEPAPAPSVLGCMISMLRFNIRCDDQSTFRQLTRSIYQQIWRAGRRGYPFLFSWLSKYLVGITLKTGKLRLGHTALSFIGKLDLERHYGEIELKGVNAFITNNLHGPQFSGFGKILFGRLEIDLNYLSSEISEELAQKLTEEVKLILENIAKDD